ncbi:CPBP family intramembrane metalloprotease [Brevibacterium sp. 91QC2O2]|uniref:CPBP family intramembrane glutamic endopeptidase n=1 Tax=Brevibacterium sp. 91QC2O2 TaxID=2968458 RepID=UPI00211CF55E|nr:CPBP family intramembrane glutamic endopeptidase [Brevibacterium sp. 91QC2O2]MCQ9369152.1 CPBP family intramembrane metalloprotease [Brevibacterium sp. 91QC2O2]
MPGSREVRVPAGDTVGPADGVVPPGAVSDHAAPDHAVPPGRMSARRAAELTRSREPVRSSVGWPPIVVFVVAACGLAWLVALPLWIGDGLRSPLAGMLIPLMMYAPVAAVLVVFAVFRRGFHGKRLARIRFLGMWPLGSLRTGSWRRFVVCCLAAVLGPGILVAGSVLVAAACGWLQLDPLGLSGYRETLVGQLPANTIPAEAMDSVVWTGVFSQLLIIPAAGATVNAVLTLGEELGWRGFLLPALRGRWGQGAAGTWAALLVTGAVWGLWHAPVILLGYNFGRTDVTGVLLMVVGCMAWGVLFGWLRLRSRSVWPAVFAHGTLNAAAGLYLLFSAAGAQSDPALVSPLGAAGWIVCAVVILVLVAAGQFGRVRLER